MTHQDGTRVGARGGCRGDRDRGERGGRGGGTPGPGGQSGGQSDDTEHRQDGGVVGHGRSGLFVVLPGPTRQCAGEYYGDTLMCIDVS